MLTIKAQIDTTKLGDNIATKVERNIEDSEIFEHLSYEEKRELSNLINQSVHAVVCHFDNIQGVLS